MQKFSNKYIKKIWHIYKKCAIYVQVSQKLNKDPARDDLLSKSMFFMEYCQTILNKLNQEQKDIIVNHYLRGSDMDKNQNYSHSGWYSKIRRANQSFFKYFDKSSLKW